MKNKVVFFQIKNAKEKIIKVLQTAMYHFERKEKLLIQVQEETSLKFIDELLWKCPQESFLPHIATNDYTNDYIVITTSRKNLNSASFLFNLSPDIVQVDTNFSIIYDFDDNISSSRKINSQKRFDLYQKAGFLIESR